MNISSKASNFSVEEDSSDHEDGSEERTPESRISSWSCCSRSTGSGSSLRHGGSESWVSWGERGSFAHPIVGLTFTESREDKGESKSFGSSLKSLDGVLGSNRSRLEVDSFFSNWSSSLLGGVGGGVKHSHSAGGLRDSTVDV